jgi:hypothetical protein
MPRSARSCRLERARIGGATLTDVADAQLEADLRDLIALLGTYNEEHWSRWFRTSLRHVEAGDGYGLQHLLGAYGGMGSFSDLVIHPANGHQIDRGDVDAVNDQLRALGGAVWSRASALLRESRSGLG